MKVIVDYDNATGEIKDTIGGTHLGSISTGYLLEEYKEPRKLKEYVLMVKELKESGFTADEIIELIGRGH